MTREEAIPKPLLERSRWEGCEYCRDGYRIICQDCGASSRYAYIQQWHDSKGVAQCQAARAWNRRVKPDSGIGGNDEAD